MFPSVKSPPATLLMIHRQLCRELRLIANSTVCDEENAVQCIREILDNYYSLRYNEQWLVSKK